MSAPGQVLESVQSSRDSYRPSQRSLRSIRNEFDSSEDWSYTSRRVCFDGFAEQQHLFFEKKGSHHRDSARRSMLPRQRCSSRQQNAQTQGMRSWSWILWFGMADEVAGLAVER